MKRREFIALLGSAAVARPRMARAQQSAMPGVGFLGARSAQESASVVNAFRRGLAETGYSGDRDVTVDYRWAEGWRYPAKMALLPMS
jgi:putative tryptophan/tyrosine transport system substrate-binding protein